MEFYEVLEKRRSMRAFHSEPVDQKVIERVKINSFKSLYI
jgi:nitroreductase